MCGSAGLYETLGDARARAILEKTLAILSHVARNHLGTVVKNVGDQILCTFATAADAAEAAVAMQRSVKQATAGKTLGSPSLAIRVGFYDGPVIARGTDVFGDAVNVAARLVSHAKTGQILIAKQTVKTLPKKAKVRAVGSTQVKGKDELFELFEIVWEHKNLTVVQGVSITKPSSTHLLATFANKSVEVSRERPALHMGRGPDNEFVVPDALASRVHARIEYRRGRFVLVDQSLNGTYVRVDGGSEVVLLRDEIALEASGLISLGRSADTQDELCIRFTVRAGGDGSNKRVS